jgi:hypothetical protein
MRYRINRRDNGSKALEKYAESLGFVVYSDSGAVDAHLALGRQVAPVEWKNVEGGLLTPTQQRLIAKGYPIRFISRPEQLDALKVELSR